LGLARWTRVFVGFRDLVEVVAASSPRSTRDANFPRLALPNSTTDELDVAAERVSLDASNMDEGEINENERIEKAYVTVESTPTTELPWAKMSCCFAFYL
jgi:hypothetical protein